MRQAARIFSYILHPYLVPIYVVLLMMVTGTVYHYYPLRMQLYLVWVVVLYSAVLPILLITSIKRLLRLRGRELPRRYRPVAIFVVGIVCYALFATTMMKAPSLMLFRKMAVAGIMCNIYSLVMLRFSRRISTHLTAMGAATAIFTMLNIAGEQPLFWVLLGTLLASGMLASAQLYLGRHRSLQLLAAYVGGFLVTAFAMLYI
ncbi:MAG: hypothetical protein IKV12_07350 [Alistipes sp.]|nr:hypothetical protein [Alistipes sp.]